MNFYMVMDQHARSVSQPRSRVCMRSIALSAIVVEHELFITSFVITNYDKGYKEIANVKLTTCLYTYVSLVN